MSGFGVMLEEAGFESEFGCIQPEFAFTADGAKIYFGNGEVAKCRCGKPGTQIIQGYDSFCARCSDCL